MSELKEIVKDLKDMTEKMSNWETEFLQGVDERLSNGIGLTDRQIEIVNQIWDKIVK